MKLIDTIKNAAPDSLKKAARKAENAAKTAAKSAKKTVKEKAPAKSRTSTNAKSPAKEQTGKTKDSFVQALIDEGMTRADAVALKISSQDIRRVMDRSGWTAYEAFAHMCEIALNTGETFKNIAKENLWRNYRNERAEMLADLKPWKDPAPAPISEERFRKLFYTREQLAAMEDFRKGSVTVFGLCDFFEIKLPKEIMELEGDVLKRVKFKRTAVKEGDLFFCAPDKWIDKDALQRAKPAVVVGYPSYKKTVEEAGIPFVSRTTIGSYILDMANLWRQEKNASVVAITGSVGKTTTTGMIGSVVSAAKSMHRVHGNQNTSWQVADFTMKLKDSHEVFVQECSGSFPSQLEKTSRIVQPDIFVLTNVGNGHIGRYDGKQERLLYEKTALDRHAAKGAVGIVNGDDELLSRIRYEHEVKTFGITNSDVDFRAEDIDVSGGLIRFTVVEKDGQRTPVVLKVVGQHNIYNALAAFGVGVLLGIERETIASALTGFETEGARQNLETYSGRQLFVDCLSATEESMRTTIQTVNTIDIPEGNRRFMVLGDVTALGDQAEPVHRRIGTMVSEVCKADEVLFYYNDMRYAHEEAKARGVNCRFTDSREELESWLSGETEDGDLIAIKAGHATECLRIVDDLYGVGLFIHDKFSTDEPVVTLKDYQYKCIHDYGAVLMKANKKEKATTIQDVVDDYPVRYLDSNVYAGADLCSIELPAGLKGIGSGAFRNCKNLIDITFPEALLYIGPGAFEGCITLSKVDLSGGCTTIGEKAFAGCKSLKEVILPAGLKTLAEDAFDEEIKPYITYADEAPEEHGF